MAVSVDMVQTFLRQVMEKLDGLTHNVDLDRRNFRVMYDNMNIELGRKLGSLDAKIELGLADLQEQLNRIETKFDERLNHIDQQLAYLVKAQQDRG